MSKEAKKLALDDLISEYHMENSSFAKRVDEIFKEALAEQPAQQEPFGYFKAMPFGWTDCAETDEGAIALYQRPQPAQQEPTKAMIDAAEHLDWSDADVRGNIVNMWQAMLAAAPQPAQPAQQEPWGACVNGRVFVGRLPDHVRKFSEDEGMPIQWLYTSPQPAQPAQPAQQEPVAKDDADIYEFWARNKETERQQKPMAYGKPWVGLDHDDIHALMNEYFYEGMQPSAIHFANFARAIEAKLKEKNT